MFTTSKQFINLVPNTGYFDNYCIVLESLRSIASDPLPEMSQIFSVHSHFLP